MMGICVGRPVSDTRLPTFTEQIVTASASVMVPRSYGACCSLGLPVLAVFHTSQSA